MKRKLTLQDYVSAMDAFPATLPPLYPVTVERHDLGDAARYVFSRDGLEVGRIEVVPTPAWETGAADMFSAATAHTRGIAASMLSHGDLDHIPEREQTLHALYCDVLKRWRAHMDLWLGRGMWEGVWKLAANSEPTESLLQRAYVAIDRLSRQGKTRGTAERRKNVVRLVLTEEATHREIALKLFATEDTIKKDVQWLRDRELLP